MTSFAPDSLVLNRKLPLWYQVSQSLRASILGRHADAPLRLPTEDELAAHYGVSVLTMRQALKELEDEGLISRHRRRGTFIDPGARRAAPVKLLGTVDAIVAQQSILWRFYHVTGNPRWWALSYPLGAGLCLGMTLNAMRRVGGQTTTTWRGTTYRGGARTAPESRHSG